MNSGFEGAASWIRGKNWREKAIMQQVQGRNEEQERDKFREERAWSERSGGYWLHGGVESGQRRITHPLLV